jgi:hypothetical protein
MEPDKLIELQGGSSIQDLHYAWPVPRTDIAAMSF